MKTTDNSICERRKNSFETAGECKFCNGLEPIDEEVILVTKNIVKPINNVSADVEAKIIKKGTVNLPGNMMTRLQKAADESGLSVSFLVKCILMQHLKMVTDND